MGTVVGIAPRTAAYVYLAGRAQRLDLGAGDNVWLLVGSGVVLLGAIAFITHIARRAMARLTNVKLVAEAEERYGLHPADVG